MWWAAVVVAIVVAVVLAARGYTNCLYVAVGLWLQHRGRSWLATRRTVNLGGKGLHFSHIRETATTLEMVDYVPLNAKQSLIDTGDSVLAFRGARRTRVYDLRECVIEPVGESPSTYGFRRQHGIFSDMFTSKRHD